MQRSHLLLGSLLVCAALTALVMARAVPKGENYAFMVACGEYDNPKQFGELPYTIKELLEFRDVLVNSGDYKNDNIKLLHDKRTEDKKRWLPRKNNIIDELDLLLNRLGDDDSLTVVLNGHGLQPKGDVAYFCPLNADVTDKNTWIPLEGKDGLFEKLKEKKLRSKLLIVNACRDDPNAPKPTMAARTVNFDKKRKYEVPGGFAALFSCQPGQFSYYYDRTKNEKCPNIERSLFFHHLIEAWQGKYATGEEMELEDVFKEVLRRTATEADTLFGDAQNPFPVRGYQGEWKIPIRRIVKELKEVTNSIGMKLVYIPKGTFSMGSSKEEQDDALADYEKWEKSKPPDYITDYIRAEGPEHEVEITKGFYLGVYEVTQEEYEKVMEKNPSDFSAKGDRKAKVEGMDTSRFPVENVSYKDAVEFCRKLSELPEEKQKKRVYRLPTEAEWEYACRGGATSKTPFHFGKSLSSKLANFNGKYPYGGADEGDYLERTCKVGSYQPNGFSLYDMHGNVWEWCSDWYGKDYYGKSPKRDPEGPSEVSDRVIRGGSWNYDGRYCRSAHRYGNEPAVRDSDLGLRVALVSSGQ